MDTVTRLELIETRNTLHDLISSYAQGLDNRDPALLRVVFHDDALLDSGIFGRCEGLEAILAAADGWWAGATSMHHWMANPLVQIDLEAGTATGLTALNCVSTFVEGGPAHVGGRYVDTFSQVGGRWAISERVFDVQFVSPLPDWKAVQGTEAAASVGSLAGA